jgi:HK97 family phage portal protein
MGFFDFFRPQPAKAELRDSAPKAAAEFYALDDPALVQFLRDGLESSSGVTVSVTNALANPAVFRSVSLISYSIGMLPLHLIDSETKEKAKDHPLFQILHREPNNWQTAFDFRTLMQLRALVKGNAYAMIVRSRDLRGREERIIRLVPLNPDLVTIVQNDDWSIHYEYQPIKGGKRILKPEEVFHLRGLSLDGLNGLSLVQQARNAIGLAIAADLALGRVFKNGSFVDGTLETDKTLSDTAYARLKASWEARYSGADNAGKTPILEEGVKYANKGPNPKDAQSNETRARQVEEIARVFGIPRPLLMVDETSWGSGIDVLGQFFVRYALNPWFEAWQQAIERSLLVGPEKNRYEAKFNAGALLRGSMKDQGEFFAKALGAGGHKPWMEANEVRDMLDMPEHPDGKGLVNPMTQKAGQTIPADGGGSNAA